ncbi:MAG: hypothetical protein ACOYN0_03730 [Phycisphaerales bacterium]
MPPLPALQLSLSQNIERRLSALPRDLVFAAVVRIEHATLELSDAGMVPAEFLLFSALGERPASTGEAGLSVVDARAAIADLSALAERLTSIAGLAQRDPFAVGLLTAEQLCASWKVSRKTLDRLRKRGLVGRRITLTDGKARIGFSPEVVRRFFERHERSIVKAGAFSRIPAPLEREMIRRAVKYKRLLGMSLNAAALRISQRFGRSHEAVRQLLKRHDSRVKRAKSAAHSRLIMRGPAAVPVAPPEPIFDETSPLNARRRAVAFRAWRLGVSVSTISRKFRRSRASVRRAINLSRAERLWPLLVGDALVGPMLPTFERREAAEVLLSPVPVRTGLGAGAPRDLLAFLDSARSRQPPIAHEERTRVVAYQFIRFRARKLIESLSRSHPQAGAVDHAETLLRWAARLKSELIRPHLRLMLETVELRLGRPAVEIPSNLLIDLLRRSLDVMGRVVDGFEPARAGRLASPMGLAIDKLVSTWGRQHSVGVYAQPSKRAVQRIPVGVAFSDWTLTVCPWQRWLEPDPRIRALIEARALPVKLADTLGARFGLMGNAPLTVTELAARLRVSPIRLAIVEHEMLAQALSVSRGRPCAQPDRARV